jgi:hypothetical protein
MKQLLSLFLFLLPCLAWAQYPSNGNQKITLGEQTSADGLIWRGVAATDTVRKPSVDTMAYMVLDTTTNIIWHYKKATSNAWLRLNLLPSDTASIAYVNTYGTQTVNGAKTFTNSATFSSTFTGNPSSGSSDVFKFKTTGNTGNGVLYSYSDVTGVANGIGSNLSVSSGGTLTRPNTALGAWAIDMDNRTNPSIQIYYINPSGTFSIPFKIDSFSNVGIGTGTISQRLHVVGNGRFTAVSSGTFSNNLNITSDGTLTTATSDIKFKYNIRPLNYGLSTLLQLKPVNFQWIEGEEEDLGFIAQDVAEIIPEAVNTNWNSDLLFRYESLIPILTKAIQEQQALIKALEQRIINLENK